MSPSQRRIAEARQRMLEAADRRDTVGGGNEAWNAWQQAAADFWVLKHPDAARFRRGDPGRLLTVDEIRELEHQLQHARGGVPDDWRLQPLSKTKIERLAQVGWCHELMAALYDPIAVSLQQLRRRDRAGVETAIRFLEADPYCHRSGYAKADIIHRLARVELTADEITRLRAVVMRAVREWARREFRSYIRLARQVDSDELRRGLRALAESDEQPARRQARWMLSGLGESGWERQPRNLRIPAGWSWFEDDAFDFTFALPHKTVAGERIELERQSRPDGVAVHVSSPDLSEVYFELRQATHGSPDAAIATLRQSVTERFPDVVFRAPEAAEIAGLPGVAISFEFGRRVRRAVFTEQTEPFFGAVYDPRSIWNDLIFMSLAPTKRNGG